LECSSQDLNIHWRLQTTTKELPPEMEHLYRTSVLWCWAQVGITEEVRHEWVLSRFRGDDEIHFGICDDVLLWPVS
jgi:hypothetical protein